MRKAERVLRATCLVAALAGCASAPPPPAPQRSAEELSRDEDLGTLVTRTVRGLDAKTFRAVTARAVAGRVLLAGAVAKPGQRRQAEAAAAAIGGVTEIRNEILLAETAAFDRFLPDPARERALRARLAAIPGVAAADYGLAVIDGAVYLTGTARSPEELARVKAALLADDGVKWVVEAVVTPR